MKHIILFILFLHVSLSIYAQEIKYHIKSTTKQSDAPKTRAFDYKYICKDSSFYYFNLFSYYSVFQQKAIGATNNHSVLKVSKNLKVLKKMEIEVNKKEKTKGIFNIKDNLVAISHDFNKKEETHTLNLRVINKSSLKVVNKKSLFSLSNNKYFTSVKYSIKQSKDKSKLAIFFRYFSDNSQKFGIMVINEDIDILWKDVHFWPTFKGSYILEDFEVTNKGEVYVLGRIRKITKNDPYIIASMVAGNEYKVLNTGFTYQLSRIADERSLIDNVKLSIADYDIRKINIEVNEDNEKIFAYGMYSNKGQISVQGTFISEIDMEAEAMDILDKAKFSYELKIEGLSKKELKKYHKKEKKGSILDPFNYNLGRIKYKPNGDKYFIAEQRLYGYANPYIYFKDIYIVNISKNNKITNINKINKRQRNKLVSNISYSELYKNNKHYFIFNTTHLTHLKKCLLVSVDNEGNQKSVELYKYKGLDSEAFISLKSDYSDLDYFVYPRLSTFAKINYYIEVLSID